MNNIFLILALFSLLAGCISNDTPPADIYTLSLEQSKQSLHVEPGKKSPLVIKIAPIRAAQEFTGNEIIYTDRRYTRNSYVHSRWNDAPVKLLQTLIQVNIEKSTLFKAVVPPTSLSKADLLLESTLLDFSHHINNDGTSKGVIRIRSYLIDSTTGTVTATQEFVSAVPTATENAKGAVEALNKAAAIAANDLVIWLAE